MGGGRSGGRVGAHRLEYLLDDVEADGLVGVERPIAHLLDNLLEQRRIGR